MLGVGTEASLMPCKRSGGLERRQAFRNEQYLFAPLDQRLSDGLLGDR